MKNLIAGLVTAAAFAAVPDLIAYTSSTAVRPVPIPSVLAKIQQNLIGTVTSIDSVGGRVTLKTDAGATVTF